MQIQKIRQLNKQDLSKIINLHLSVLTESFLNNFGRHFLEIAYLTIFKSQNNICLIIKEKNDIKGFIVATLNGDKFNFEVINKNLLPLSYQLLKSSLKNPKLLLELIKWKLKKPNPHKIKPEIQFIAISPPLQGKSWGSKLIKEINKEFKKNGIKKYRVGTKSSNEMSNKFYKKLGFKLLYKDNFFGDNFNYYISPKF